MALSIGRPRRRHRPTVDVYTRENCGLCQKAEELVAAEAGRARVRRFDIDEDPELQQRYNVRVPVIVVDGREVAEGRVEPGTIVRAVRRAQSSRWSVWRRA